MRPHEILKSYVKELIESQTNSLIVKGTAGIGKTYTILKTLEEMGLKEQIHYIYFTGYTTPLQLFNTLSRSTSLEFPKLFIFDDLEGIINNKLCVAMLKSGLWEARGRRVITYNTSSSKVKNKGVCEFNGKMLLILNSIREENTIGESLIDRGLYYCLDLTTAEITAYIENIISEMETSLNQDERFEVWRKIKILAHHDRFSLRSVSRAFSFYKNNSNWFDLFIHSLSLSREIIAFYTIQNDPNLTKEEIRDEFQEQTSKSRATFYRVKKRMRE